MIFLETYIMVTGIVYLLLMTTYKYNLNYKYEDWRELADLPKFIDHILPKQFCTLCLVTQLSAMVSFIIVVLAGMPAYNIITLALSSPMLVLSLETLRRP